MKPNFIALVPCFVFLIMFAFLNIIYSTNHIGGENFPIFAAFVAIIVSIFTFQKNESFNERVEVFIQGSSQLRLVHTCYVFFLTTIFTAVLDQTGNISSITNLTLHCIPKNLVLPMIFVCTSLFSYTVNLSIGTIALFMPIAIKIALCTGLNIPIIAATIVCGSIFGENLFILSKLISTTEDNIAKMKNIFLNIKIIFPAFISTILILAYQNNLIANTKYLEMLPPVTILDFIKTFPYFLIFYLTLIGLDFIITIVLGIMSALVIGLCLNNITTFTTINIMFDGFYHSKSMVNVYVLMLLLSGLSTIVIHNGGVEYLIQKFRHKIKNKNHSKFTTFCLAAFVNFLIAIVIAGQFAKKTYLTLDIIPEENSFLEESNSFIDIQPCVLQGMLPYIPQLLLAASLANVSFISLLPYLYYQYVLIFYLLITILSKTKRAYYE